MELELSPDRRLIQRTVAIVPNWAPECQQQGEPYRKMGWHASDTRSVSFPARGVPESNLSGRRGGHGQPIGRLQAIQGKLAEMATEIEAARLKVRQLVIGRGPGA